MDTKLPPIRSDVVTVPSVLRPTPTPIRVSFGEVLAKGASTLVAGAQAAMEVLPGGPLIAAAIRGGGTPSSPMMSGSFNNGLVNTPAEGPSALNGSSVGGGFANALGTGTGTGTSTSTGSLDSSLQQSQEMNLYFLQIQQEVNQQSQTFTTLSNVMKSEADTIKNAIGNLR
jgi:hypothetical protein